MTQDEFYKRYQYSPTKDCLGEGGFGKVYKAYDTHLDKYVAIKMAEVKPGLEQVRLKHEVELINKLPTHPNIARYEECYTFLYPTGEYDFAILQYYEVGNLEQLLLSGNLNDDQKDSILRLVLDGIGFLHDNGIIHRDLKPQNILIADRNGEYIPKITDFGISKKLDVNKSSVFTNSLAGAGTLAYASPEQLMGKTIKKNTDLWSFGVIVCYVFTGKLPFTFGNQTGNNEAGRIELFRQIMAGDVSELIGYLNSCWLELVQECIVVDNEIRIGNSNDCLRIIEKQTDVLIDQLEIIEEDESFEIVWHRGFCGFRNSLNEMITQFKYDDASPFKEGLARVKLNGKWGFIDKQGKEIIPIQYYISKSFRDGLAAVRNENWGYIDKQGKVIVPLKYDRIYKLQEGLAAVKFTNNKGFCKMGFIDKQGKVIIPFYYQYAGSFCEGLAAVKLNGKWGFIDKQGNDYTPIKYDEVKSFSEGLAALKLNGKWGFINKTEKVIIPFYYECALSFCEGLAAVKLNGKWGFINKVGNEIIQIKYDYVNLFREGLAAVKLNGKWGYIDIHGKEIIPFKYDGAFQFCENLACVEFNNKYGYINKHGKEIIPIQYDEVETYFSEGLAKVKLNGKYGYINKQGKEIVLIQYDEVDSYFSEGLVKVKLNGKYGYINKQGEEIVLIQYDEVNSFSEGLAAVKLNGKWGYIDKQGKDYTPIKYDEVNSFTEGFAAVKLNGKWGFINKVGNEIIQIKYDDVMYFECGLAAVILNDKWGCINRNGDVVIPIIYNVVFWTTSDTLEATLEGQTHYFDFNGNKIEN